MSSHRPRHPGRRARVAAVAAALAAAVAACPPAALAWHGDVEVRKVNIGGPPADTFRFTVETRAHGSAVWEPTAAPLALRGAASAAGPFTTGGAQATAAVLTGLESGGEVAVPAPAVRDWRALRVTEVERPQGYATTASCSLANSASGGVWTPGLDATWGAWTTVPTTAGGGPGVESALRYLPEWVAPADRGAWRVTCTFTNTYRARVKVLKRFLAPQSASPRVTITVAGTRVDTSTGAAAFADGDASDWIEVAGGSDVALAESGAQGTVLTDYDAVLECRSGTDGTYGDWALVAAGYSGTLAGVQPGRDYECRFTNTGRPPRSEVAGPTPSGGSVTPSGAPVTPSGSPTARRASARVVGTTGCVRAYALADVRGREIERVTFRINGRTVRTLDAPNVAGMFRLRVRASSLPRGASRVRADVVFKAGSQTAPRTLTLAFSRCPRRTVPPPFTG